MYILPCKSLSYFLILKVLCGIGTPAHASEQPEGVCESVIATKETFYRRVRINEDDFAVLANDCNTAHSLAIAARDDLALLRRFIDVASLPKGLIVAIETRHDPWADVSDYDPRYAESTESLHQNPRAPDRGRKFVRSHAGPYFRLSFSVNKKDVVSVVAHSAPDFVVFLATDEYFGTVSQELEAIVRRGERWGHEPSELLTVAFAFMRSRLAIIDLKLMQLWRREVLWLAALEASELAPDVKSAAKEKIIKLVDAEFKTTFENRPMD